MKFESKGRWAVNKRFVIGTQDNPMMVRWRLIQTPWFGIYVHFIHREDLDPVPHDHPWVFWRMVLRGGYVENYFENPRHSFGYPQVIMPFRPLRFPTTHAHRIVMVKPGTISLVVVGRKQRVWGFWGPEQICDMVPNRKWVAYHDAFGLRPTEGVK